MAIPCYFFVKAAPASKWIYTLTSLTVHVVFTLLVCLVLGKIFGGWDDAIIYFGEKLLSAAMGVILLIDVIVNALSKVPKR